MFFEDGFPSRFHSDLGGNFESTDDVKNIYPLSKIWLKILAVSSSLHAAKYEQVAQRHGYAVSAKYGMLIQPWFNIISTLQTNLDLYYTLLSLIEEPSELKHLLEKYYIFIDSTCPQ